MNSNKKKELADLLKFETEEDKLDFVVQVLHFSFMDEIKNQMDMKSINSKDLANKLGVSESYISQLFAGDKLINLKTLAKIQKEMDIRFKITTIQNRTERQISKAEKIYQNRVKSTKKNANSRI